MKSWQDNLLRLPARSSGLVAQLGASTCHCISAALLGFAMGCSADSEPTQNLEHTVRRILPAIDSAAQSPAELVADDGSSKTPALRQRLLIPKDLAPWSVVGAEARVLPGPAARNEERVLTIEGKKKNEVHIPGPFPRTFNQLVLRIETQNDIVMLARYRLKGRTVISTVNNTSVLASSGLQTIVFDLPHVRRLRDPIDEIVIHATEVQGPWSLHSVEGFVRPIADFLPREDPTLVTAGNQARTAIGLSTDAERTIQVEVPNNGRLDFAYAWPDYVRLKPQTLGLRIKVESPSQEFPTQNLVELDLVHEQVEIKWHSVSADMNPWSGKVARLRFQLQGEQDGLIALSEPLLSVNRQDAPTVLLVTSDTHRADHVEGATPNTKVLTPHLAQLAKRGVSFSNCFSSTNVTVPSHVALLTATHPRDTGVLTNVAILDSEARTLAECFREQGYLTYAATSLRFLGRPRTNIAQGFDRLLWPEGETSLAEETLTKVHSWLPEAEGRPLFLWIHLFDAHFPYQPPEEFGELYYSSDPKSESLPEPDFPVPARFTGIRDVEWFRAQYRGEISYLDAELGKLLQQPRIQAGWTAVTADHGESLGAHGIYWGHHGVYPDTLHIPMILAGPGLPNTLAGRVLTEPVRQIDLGRTLLDWTGQATTAFPGSAFALSSDSQAESQEAPRFSISNHAVSASVTINGYHLILYLETPRRRRFDGTNKSIEQHLVELYNLERDPECTHDIAHEEPTKTKALRSVLIDWLLARQTTGWGQSVGASSEMQKQLAALGYLETSTGPANDTPLFDADCSCKHCLPYQE